jgi:ABC-type multidrug transport system ATPase subunit
LTALLGPNGAGKTTFVSAVATLLKPSAGTLRVGGIDAIGEPQRVRRIIGLAGQYASVEPAMTGRENLVLVGRLFGLNAATAKSAAAQVLETLHLTDAADRLVRTYSGGMRRRLDLGASLVGAPRLLLLDEPTTGLDPGSRLDLWDAIRSLVAGGTDVLMTTQYLEEADQLAGRIAIIDNGRIVKQGRSEELKAAIGAPTLQVDVPTGDEERARVALAGIGEVRPDHDGGVCIGLPEGASQMADVVRALDAAGVRVDHLELHQPSLDDVFAEATGRRLEGAEDAAATAP